MINSVTRCALHCVSHLYVKQNLKMKKLVLISISIIVTLGTCVWLSARPDGGTSYPIIFAAPATSIMTFFGLISLLSEKEENISDSTMRSAITGALVVMYIVVVGYGIFTAEGYGGISSFGQTLLTSFTSIVGISIAFYFGSSAYIQKNEDNKHDGSKK